MSLKIVVACLALCALASLAVAEGPAVCRKVVPPFVTDLGAEENWSKWPGAQVAFGFSHQVHKPWGGDAEHVPEVGRLMIHVGNGFPIHRHPADSGELLYTISGTGLHEVLAPGSKTVEKQVMNPGTLTYVPAGSIHRVTNTGDVDMDLLVVAPHKFSPFTVFEDWPASSDAEGQVVPVMPWEATCPKGQELNDEL